MSTVPAKLLKIHEAALALGVADKTLRRWESAGKLVPKRSHGNQRLYDYEQVMSFKAKRDGISQESTNTRIYESGNNVQPLHSQLPTSHIHRSAKFAPILLGLGAMLLVWSAGTGIEGIAKARAKEQAKQYAMGKALGIEFEGQRSGEVLAAIAEANQDVFFSVTVPAIFSNTARFTDAVTFEADIIAPNVIYALTAGTGITITGGQNPTISNTKADPNTFKTIKVGSTTFDAGSGTDTLTFASSGNATVSIDTTNKKLTIGASSPDLSAAGGWTDGGTSVYVTTTTDKVGIGTTSPSTLLHVAGASTFTGVATFSGGDIILADGTVINIGGSGSDVAYNVIGDSTSGASASMTSDDDLYIEGNLEVDGTIVGSLSGGVTTTMDAGSVVFVDSTQALSGDSAAFFWEAATDELGIGTNSPSYNLHVAGTAGITGNITFGDATTDTITLSSQFVSSLIPLVGSTNDIGTSAKRWAVGYFDTINATNITSSSTNLNGTTSEDFTINTDNATADTESSTLTFERGTPATNAQFRWDATNKYISTNAPGFVISADSTISMSGKSALIVNQIQSQDIFTASASGTTRLTIGNNGSVTQSSTATTTNAYNLTADSVTTGTGMNMSFDGLSTGKGMYIESTSTAFSSGQLGYLYWNPGSSTTATGDILRLDVGSNGIVGNILNVMNGGSSVFSVGQAQITAALPTQFTAAGDVSIAYDIQFTNQTASYLKSLAPLIVEAGESFENNNLTLKTYGTGNVLIDSMALNVSQAASISGRLLVGTQTNPDNLGQMYVTNNITYGKALAIFNQTESQSIFTASSSGTTRFVINNDGRTSVGNANPVGMLNVDNSNTATFGKASLIVIQDETEDIFTASASGTTKFTISSAGNITTVDNAWLGLGASAGQIEFDDQTVDEVNILNARLGVGTSTPGFRLDVADSQAATVAAMITNSETGTNADGLAIKLGFTGNGTAPTGDPPTGNRFLVFLNGGGTVQGAIDSAGNGAVAYKTSGADFAEYFKKADPAESLPVGAVVCLTDSGTGGVTACRDTNSQSIVGIVSLYAGFVGAMDRAGDPGYVLVGLVGQVPASVDPTSAPIKTGDVLAVGATAGTIAKATTTGTTVGRALASWTPGQSGFLNLHVQQGYTSIGSTEETVDLTAVSSQSSALSIQPTFDTSDTVDTFDTVDALTVKAVNTEVLDTLTAKGQLVVVGDATFKGNVIFEKLVTFITNIVFRGVVSFEKAPSYATKDVAGYAQVSKYTDRVDVVFDDTYEVPPIVTISLNTETATDSAAATGSAFLSDGVYAAVTDVTATGFSIILPSPALQDYTYSWSAIRVVDPKRVKSTSAITDLLNQEAVAGVATESGNIATGSAEASGAASISNQ